MQSFDPGPSTEAPLIATAFARAGQGLVISDADGAVAFANAAFLQMTGYGAGEVIGRDAAMLHGAAAAAGPLGQALRAGEAFRGEVPSLRKDGLAFRDRVDLRPFQDEAGRSFLLGVHVEVTAAHAEAQAARDEELREADHRVKNNMQMISSLMVLQGRRAADPAAKTALQGMTERLSAVSAAQRRLFRESVEGSAVDVMARELITDLGSSLAREGVVVRLDLEPARLPVAQAAPLALIINELVGNALKHGFPPGRDGAVDVSLRRTAEGLELTVSDDGIGDAGGQPGFGGTIVKLLSQQLKGRLETPPTPVGRQVVLTVPTAAERS